MANLLTNLFRRQPDEISRYTTTDYIKWLTSNARYGLLGGMYGGSYATYKGKPTERIENSFTGYIWGAYKTDPVVYACMTKRSSVFSEARFLWRKVEKDGAAGDFFADEGLSLLQNPWPNGTTGELLTRMIQDVDLAGNFYAVNEGDRLRRLRPDYVQIVLSGDPLVDADIDVMGYVYTSGGPDTGGQTKAYLPEEICHWSPKPDPDALYRGMSWVTPLVREIQGDLAAGAHKAAFFRNGAVLGPIIKVPAGMTPQQFKEFIEADQQAHAGAENAYKTMYVGGGADVTLGSANMQQMDFKSIQGHYETRICAAAEVPAVIAGISEGLGGSSLNQGNYSSSKRLFADATLRPLWRSACAALATIVDVPKDAELWYDERGIAFLREDAKDIAEITKTQILAIEAGMRAGYKPDPMVNAVNQNNLDLLIGEHTGLFSVQMQAPGAGQGGVPGQQVGADPFADGADSAEFGALRSDLREDPGPKDDGATDGAIARGRDYNPAPGRQVFTAEGARKYGLAIGMTIPPGLRKLTPAQEDEVRAMPPETRAKYLQARGQGLPHAAARKAAGGSAPPRKAAPAKAAKKAAPAKAAPTKKAAAPKKAAPVRAGSTQDGPDHDPQAARRREMSQIDDLGTKVREDMGGNEGDLSLYRTPDGKQVLLKSFSDTKLNTAAEAQHGVDAELLGSRVVDAVGARAAVVAPRGPREVLVDYVDAPNGQDFIYGSDDPKATTDRLAGTDRGRLLGVADYITANGDRWEGNLLVQGDDDVIAVDHGGMFPSERVFSGRKVPSSIFTSYLRKPGTQDLADRVDVNPADLAAIRVRLEAMRPDFVRQGRTDWHDRMMSRLGELEERADPNARARLPKAEGTAPAKKATPAKVAKKAPARSTERDFSTATTRGMRERADAIDKYVAEHPELPQSAPSMPGFAPRDSIEGARQEAAALRKQADSMDAARRDSVLAFEGLESAAQKQAAPPSTLDAPAKKATPAKVAKKAPAKAPSLADAPDLSNMTTRQKRARLKALGFTPEQIDELAPTAAMAKKAAAPKGPRPPFDLDTAFQHVQTLNTEESVRDYLNTLTVPELRKLAREAGIGFPVDAYGNALPIPPAERRALMARRFIGGRGKFHWRSETPSPDDIERRYNPDQPRAPKRTPIGGRWVSLAFARRSAVEEHIAQWHGDEDDVDDLIGSVASGGTKVGPLNYGSRSSANLGDFGDGTERVVTTYRAERDADADQLASTLGRAIGVPAPRMLRVEEDGTVADLIEGMTWAEHEQQILDDIRVYELEGETPRSDHDSAKRRQQRDLERQRADMLASDAALRLGVLDLLAGIDERDGGTVVLTPDGVVPVQSESGWVYANGRNRAAEVAAGRLSKADGTVPPVERRTQNLVMWSAFSNIRSWRDNPLTPADVAFLRAQLDLARPQFDKLGRQRWWQFASDRLDALAQHATGTRNLFG